MKVNIGGDPDDPTYRYKCNTEALYKAWNEQFAKIR